jgi:hypothetical protein
MNHAGEPRSFPGTHLFQRGLNALITRQVAVDEIQLFGVLMPAGNVKADHAITGAEIPDQSIADQALASRD